MRTPITPMAISARKNPESDVAVGSKLRWVGASCIGHCWRSAKQMSELMPTESRTVASSAKMVERSVRNLIHSLLITGQRVTWRRAAVHGCAPQASRRTMRIAPPTSAASA